MGRTDDARAAVRNAMASQETQATDATVTPAAEDPQSTRRAEGSRIFGTVQIADELAAAVPPGTTLLIYATDMAIPGPPLAMLRLRVELWPVSFILDDADAMIPGRNLSAAGRIQLE